MKRVGMVCALVTGLIVGSVIPGYSVDNHVTKEQASQAAVKVKNGTVSKASLTKLDGQLVWEIRIDKAAIYVDTTTGAVIRTVENVDGR